MHLLVGMTRTEYETRGRSLQHWREALFPRGVFGLLGLFLAICLAGVVGWVVAPMLGAALLELVRAVFAFVQTLVEATVGMFNSATSQTNQYVHQQVNASSPPTTSNDVWAAVWEKPFVFYAGLTGVALSMVPFEVNPFRVLLGSRWSRVRFLYGMIGVGLLIMWFFHGAQVPSQAASSVLNTTNMTTNTTTPRGGA